MKNRFAAICLSAASALMLLPGAAQAQLHEGDVELSLMGGKIMFEGNDVWHWNGLAIFEANFGDLGGGPYETDDPGYDSAPGTFAAGTLVNYTAMGSLMFWNSSQWVSSVPTSEFVRFEGNLGEETRWTAGGVSGDASGLIGQAGADGVIHEHVDMSVARMGGGVPAVGAYLIQMQLTSPSLTSSDSFYMVFNRGLSDDDFEMAVQALAVPEASSWAMLAAGLGVVCAVARRRRPAA
jgi:PEP-CTERM motif